MRLRLAFRDRMSDSANVDRQGEFSVAGDAGSVALAREFIRRFLVRAAYAGVHNDVVLVASELVANALRHGGGHVLLRVAGDAGRIRLEVTDDSAARPAPRRSGVDGGWGLRLIAAMSADWGVDVQAVGKVVWSELQAAPSSLC